MSLLTKILKSFLEIIYLVRRKTPKRIHKIIGNQIKEKTILKNIFSIPYGLILLKYSKNYYRLIPLRRSLHQFPIIALDISVIDVYSEVFIEKSYERFRKIREGDIILDIGANIGIFSIKAAMKTGNKGRIIAIEPEQNNLKILKKNLCVYNNVTIIPKALGSKSGKIDLIIGIHSGAHTVDVHEIQDLSKKKIVKVPLDTIDNVIKELNIDKIDFVKIDVEGWESEVLKGALNSLSKIQYFAIASYHKEEDNRKIAQFLKTYNFKVINTRKEIYAWKKT